MKIIPCNNLNFKSALPVWCYARDPESEDGAYHHVVKPKNVDKCFNFIVRNLNGTAGQKNKSDEFVRNYSELDADYRRSGKACSVTKTPQQYGLLFTGENDVSFIRALGTKLGHSRAYDKEVYNRERTYQINKKDSFESTEAKDRYFNEANWHTINHGLKDSEGNRLGMNVYFDAVYKTNSSGERELVGFKYTNMEMKNVSLKSN